MLEQEQTIPNEDVIEFKASDFADNPQPTEESKGTVSSLDDLVIKYNGEEKKASEFKPDELVAHIQKGMNYDHIKTEVEAYKNSEQLKYLNELAKENGLKDWKEYVSTLKDNQIKSKIESRAKELETQGSRPEDAKRIAELEFNNPKPSNDEVKRLEVEFRTLHEEFPETLEFKELTDFPKEVIELIEKGKSPLVAYSKYLADTAKKTKEQAELDLKNRELDKGSFKTVKDQEKDDPFLKGFLQG